MKGELQTLKFHPLEQWMMNALSISQDPWGNQHALSQTLFSHTYTMAAQVQGWSKGQHLAVQVLFLLLNHY